MERWFGYSIWYLATPTALRCGWFVILAQDVFIICIELAFYGWIVGLKWWTGEKEWTNLSANDTVASEILKAFDNGSCKEFFNQFYSFQKNSSGKTPNLEFDKNELWYYIYFIVYDIHPSIRNLKEPSKESISDLKNFLEEKGNELSKFPDLIPFFALPYIKNIREHASFKNLFHSLKFYQ